MNTWAKWIILAVVVLTGLTASSNGLAADNAWKLEAKVVNGQVYVKADDVLALVGGKGSYSEADGTYTIHNPSTRSVTEVVKEVSPSIVAIVGKPKSGSSGYVSVDNRYNLAHGTGIIVKADGVIVTNAHVVKDMANLVVITVDGNQYEATVQHMDEESDLAVVKINAKGLQPAKLATSLNVEVGETVIAIGTPISFALRNSVTVGVISGVDRSINSMYRLLQTDAAINPGNSGGALVNLKGEVIGVNSLKFAAVGIDNLGFAIPADTVSYVLDHFQRFGKVRRASLGFDLDESWAALVGLPTKDPMKVTRVDPNSPAAKAGIKAGDILYSINNRNIYNMVDLNEQLKAFLPGDKVQVTMYSDGDLVNRTIELVEKR